MNPPLIKMPISEAQEKLDAYRESARRRADAEHAALVSAYQHLADGTPLISLQAAIQTGGFDEQMRPRLAIARADRQQVHFRWRPWDTHATFDTRRNLRSSDTLLLTVDMGQRHGRKTASEFNATVEGYALVPMIPAEVRNRMAENQWGQPSGLFILWEVEEWSDSPLRAQPDRDPLLLKHLGGDLYAVLDAWDLTEIEQLVMRGRVGH